MWPFKKQEPVAAQEPTLKNNVTAFWEWFASNSERFYDTIENKKCSDLADEVSAAVDRWLPGMAWVFGPGENGVGHSLTISGEGVLTEQFAARYCVARAPSLTNWSFYAARQPSRKVYGCCIETDQGRFKSEELWLAAYVNEQDEMIDIEVWHPLFNKMEQGQRYVVTYLVLDEVLGEFGTGNWIREVTFGAGRLKDAFPIWELREFVGRLESEKMWKKTPPTERYCTWKAEAREGYPRADIYVGSTQNFGLMCDYADAEGPIENPIKGLGVDLVFVSFPIASLPEGEEVAYRGKIEDEVIEALGVDYSGESIGGATGVDWAYIDLMLYDGQRSIDKVVKVLRRLKLPKDTHIRWFTSDKADKVVRI